MSVNVTETYENQKQRVTTNFKEHTRKMQAPKKYIPVTLNDVHKETPTPASSEKPATFEKENRPSNDKKREVKTPKQ